MTLRIFIAVMALNALHVCGAAVLHPEHDSLIARKATTEEAHNSWLPWTIISSVCKAVTYTAPTPEEILREKLKGLVFPDGRDAAGNLVPGYRLPPIEEVVVDQEDMRRVVSLSGDQMFRTANCDEYLTSLRIIIAFASKGNKHALSYLAYFFSSGDHSVRKVRWPYINQERAELFRSAQESLEGNKNQEETSEILQKLLQKGRSAQVPENKKGK